MKKQTKPTFDIDFSFYRVLEGHLEFIRNMDYILKDYNNKPYFNIYLVFSIIDPNNLNYISYEK